ncbi:luciferin sulfotransferase-like [Planococcus citri]|uniref:luciferin sulfotransferase-like n=1 Tax=Planococcus citri TaxID=170843 RepID=UPI0031FA1380
MLTYDELDNKSKEYLTKNFTTTVRTGYVKCKGYLFPNTFQNFGDKIENMEIRDDDIWVCTFPKSGTTWVQEMTWCIANELDFEAARENLMVRFPFLEFSSMRDSSKIKPEYATALPVSRRFLLDSVDEIDKLTTRRFIKTHLPFELLPKKLRNFSTQAKIIYVVRNPRDTLISYYHHCKLIESFKGTLPEFVELFFDGNVPFGPYPEHVKGYLAHINNPNVLYLQYEEMKKDLRSVIHKTADFIGKIISKDEADQLLDHLSFSSMKKNSAVNHESVVEAKKKHNLSVKDGHFMRRGIVGDWKEAIDATLFERFEKWERENLNGINFTYSV